MECTIYAPKELKWKHRKKRVLILGRYQDGLVLAQKDGLWTLPETECRRGESMEESARRALGEAMGKAVFSVSLVCAFAASDGEESIGYAYAADVTEWEEQENARAFSDLPPKEETREALLVSALRRWAWPLFPEKEEQ